MVVLPLDLLRSGAEALGVELRPDQLGQCDAFAALMLEANRDLNLTRIVEPREMVTGHFLDSLACFAAMAVPPAARVIDIGTGAGFPGVPVKIARPDLAVTLLDSSRKKLAFLGRALETLGLEDVELVRARAEEAGRDPSHRERYEIALARAVADMKALVELGLPLVKFGGALVAYKSEHIEEELDAARPMIGQLGGKVVNTARVALPHTDIARKLVVVEKVEQCPKGFPRPYARIKRASKG